MTKRSTWGGASLADALLALVLAVSAIVSAWMWPGQRALDPIGAALLLGAAIPLAWRRTSPGTVLSVTFILTVPYHNREYLHESAAVLALVALGTLAAYIRREEAVALGFAALIVVLVAMSVGGQDAPTWRDRCGMVGWVLAALVAGQAWHSHHAYVSAIIDRAERAERSRDEVARRRVAEERLRIARDLHDLLAHSITLIGVQAGVAAHLAAQEPPAERAVMVSALDTIAETCRDARHELRATLSVLRDAEEAASYEAVPGLAGLDGLVPLADAARSAGIEVTLTGHDGPPPAPDVGVAVYRIVQEALTNVVKHSQARSVRIELSLAEANLHVAVDDDGRGPGAAAQADAGKEAGKNTGRDAGKEAGFGIVGMAERARSVGGTLVAGPGVDGGFRVEAVLPMGERVGAG
ncbi:sensor histidine kinase [Embleya scabrispora]|uniref:sensor histidine kinase n=1 Tax=Embleya scabrispora TaxID=159449 RepID=UPI00039D39C5|nr:histidine kinase [Embleya scabrispora]MYS82930.1 sensor histidine kinase [Streptomyces sp. SID5474]